MQTPNEITAVLERMLPVGSIVEWSPVDSGKADLSSAEKVAAYYGLRHVGSLRLRPDAAGR